MSVVERGHEWKCQGQNATRFKVTVESQITEIIQVPESLSVFAGEEFTLDCLLIGRGLVVQGPGGVRWYKGLDRTQPAIYSQKQSSLRVTRLFPESPTDFSITISNAQSEDAGTYYCVKYKKIFNIEAEEMVGKGTVVSVIDVRGQTQEIIQVPETLSVSTGGELTLHCILMGSGSPGGVRWYKGPDRTQPAIYTQKDASPRVTRLVPESPTDFSITISNVRPEDAGTYYCVKYKKTSGTEVEETAGKGTMVSVIDCLLYSYPTGLWVGLFLSKILTGFFLLCLFLRKEHSKTTPGCRPGSARESGASKPSA
uniref:Ig-like domain-containing protein n=1 Tax=Anolis carolinensis TaxID=28377 RepID=A0A803TQT0_ANOCA